MTTFCCSQTEGCHSCLAMSIILPRNAIKSTVATNATTDTVINAQPESPVKITQKIYQKILSGKISNKKGVIVSCNCVSRCCIKMECLLYKI